MKNGKFEVGSIIKGMDLKGYMLCKILPESMVICSFQYKLGMNGADIKGGCRRIKFYPAQDACCHFSEGTKLVLVSVPDDEDVYIWKEDFSAGRIVIENEFHAVIIGLESTGFYGVHIANYLSASEKLAPFSTKVYCLNPNEVKQYKKSFNSLDKNDGIDSFVIADFARVGRIHTEPWRGAQYLALQRHTC